MKTFLSILFFFGITALATLTTGNKTVSNQSAQDTTKVIPTKSQVLHTTVIEPVREYASRLEEENTQGVKKLVSERDYYKKKYFETAKQLKQTENVVVQLMTKDSVTIEPDIANNYSDTTRIPCTTDTVRIYLKKKFLGGYKTVKE